MNRGHNRADHIAYNPASGAEIAAAGLRVRLWGSYSLSHQYVRLPEAVRVRNYAHNCESELLIELIWVGAKVPDPSDVGPDVRIQIYSAERILVLLIIGTEKNRSSAALDHAPFEVGYERATDSMPLSIGSYDQ
jgi:hypothetical protein